MTGVLLGTAASLAFVHTLVGVDHTLPFVVLGRARGWTLRRTLGVTALCGVGHVVGSIVLGLVGIGLGVAVERLVAVESVRGSLAAWGLIAFGLVYAAVSVVRTARGHTHSHVHTHADGTVHAHVHDHGGEHLHPHAGLSMWALFLVFVLGPCEALIPLLMAPAWQHHWGLVAGVTAVFAGVTIATMVAVVAVGALGLGTARVDALQRHGNALAGAAIAGSGLAIQVLGI